MDTECAIWGTKATSEQASDAVRYNSPRAGGEYLITGTAISMIPKLEQQDRAKLTTWLVDERRAGNACPAVTSAALNRVKSLPTLSVEARCDRFLLCTENLTKGISGGVRFGGAINEVVIENRQRLAAWSECVDDKTEVGALANFLHEEDLINLDTGQRQGATYT
jgi:hypothetical protein